MRNATEIAVVIDESGSMESLTSETIISFNKFLKEQKALSGEATMTVVLFSTRYRQLCVNVPIKDVKPLDRSTYKAGGFTALLDAVGSTIDAVGAKLAALPEDRRPDKVLMVIITDGEENSSREYRLDQIKKKIEEQQTKYSWQFVFLGANIDAITAAKSMGLPSGQAMNYCASPAGTKQAYTAVGAVACSVRRGGGSKIGP